jgi:hypothetical protein
MPHRVLVPVSASELPLGSVGELSLAGSTFGGIEVIAIPR